jgi:septum formation inhibitor-activating ATPase MinD
MPEYTHSVASRTRSADALHAHTRIAGFNFVFIDCPAGIDIGFLNAIAPAREAIIVTTPEITSIRDADRVAGLLEANGVFNVKLLVNRVRADMIKKNDMMSVRDVQEMLGVPLLGAIPEDTNVIISTNRGEPLVLKKKLTLAGIAYENAGACRMRACMRVLCDGGARSSLAAADSTHVCLSRSARRLVGKKDFLIDLNNPTLVRASAWRVCLCA